MDFEKLFQHPHYENYVCVNLALVFVCQVLKPYTEHGLQQVHQTIKNALAGNSQCTGPCGKGPSRWCQPCKDWQLHLKRHRRSNNTIDWTTHTTANWGASFENIACVFTTFPTAGTPVNYLDLSNACSIWERCKAFKMKKSVIEKVRNCRNNYFAHNDSLRVDGNDKAKVFDALTDLLNDSDVGCHIDKKNYKIQYELNKLNHKQTRDNLEIRDNLQGITKMVKTTNKYLKTLAFSFIIAVALTIAIRYIYNNRPDLNDISSQDMNHNKLADKKSFTYTDLGKFILQQVRQYFRNQNQPDVGPMLKCESEGTEEMDGLNETYH